MKIYFYKKKSFTWHLMHRQTANNNILGPQIDANSSEMRKNFLINFFFSKKYIVYINLSIIIDFLALTFTSEVMLTLISIDR